MALLEYANYTVPDLVKKSIVSFFNRDPMLKDLTTRNRVRRSGGTNVRTTRIKGKHSDITEINASNISVPLTKYETTSTLTGDWTKYIKPIILPHIDRDRMQSREDLKRFVKDNTDAAMMSFHIDFMRQIYMGSVPQLTGLGSLNGYKTGLTSTGFENGAIRFQSPTAQAASGLSYLGQTRVQDTVNFVDNYFNQFKEHTGIGTDFLKNAEEVKITADTYAQDEEGISLGILSIADHVKLGEEVRTYPGTAGVTAAITYTVDDLEKGKAHPTVYVANGVRYYANRWMSDAGINLGVVASTEHVYLLNPNGLEFWVNANNDFRTTKFTDHLETSNFDADVAYIVLESQFCVPNLLVQGSCANLP
jgi:hypothetical protein